MIEAAGTEITTAAHPGIEVRNWGYIIAESWIKYALRRPVPHGPNIANRLSEFLDTGGTSYVDTGWDEPDILINHLCALSESLPGQSHESLDALARHCTQSSIVSRVAIDIRDRQRLSLCGVSFRWQEVLTEIGGVSGISLVLLTDGQQIPIIEKDSGSYVARQKITSHSQEILNRRLRTLPRCVPESKAYTLEEDIWNEVLVLSEFVQTSGKEVGVAEAERIARKLAEVGFVPDLHRSNLIKGLNGDVKYIDQDILDHALSVKLLKPDTTQAEAASQQVQRYKNYKKGLEVMICA